MVILSSSKTRALYHQRKKSAKLTWTQVRNFVVCSILKLASSASFVNALRLYGAVIHRDSNDGVAAICGCSSGHETAAV